MKDWFENRSRIEKLIIAALQDSNHSHPGAVNPQHVASISKRIYSALRSERRKYLDMES